MFIAAVISRFAGCVMMMVLMMMMGRKFHTYRTGKPRHSIQGENYKQEKRFDLYGPGPFHSFPKIGLKELYNS